MYREEKDLLGSWFYSAFSSSYCGDDATQNWSLVVYGLKIIVKANINNVQCIKLYHFKLEFV